VLVGEIDDAAEAAHQPQQIDLFTEEIEFDTRRLCGVGRCQSHTPARVWLEDGGIERGKLLAERAPGRLLCAAMYMSLGGVPGMPEE